MEIEQPLLRVHEAACLLNVSKWTIYRWVEEGRLHETKLGRGSVRIFRASVASLIDTYRTSPVPPRRRPQPRWYGGSPRAF